MKSTKTVMRYQNIINQYMPSFRLLHDVLKKMAHHTSKGLTVGISGESWKQRPLLWIANIRPWLFSSGRVCKVSNNWKYVEDAKTCVKLHVCNFYDCLRFGVKHVYKPCHVSFFVFFLPRWYCGSDHILGVRSNIGKVSLPSDQYFCLPPLCNC